MIETAEHRSRIMRAVKSANTKPEMAVRQLVHRLGFRYRLHRADLPGKPDLVFPRHRKVIFVHGCFWHGHDCRRGARSPKNNSAYWSEKIARNVTRNERQVYELQEAGWRVLIVWECDLKDKQALAERIRTFLSGVTEGDIH